MKYLINLIILVFIIGISFFSYNSYTNSSNRVDLFKSESEKHLINNKTELLKSQTKDFIKEKSKIVTDFFKKEENLIEKTTNIKKEVKEVHKNNSYISFGLIFTLMVILFIGFKSKLISFDLSIFYLLLVSITAWLAGILLPMITVEVFKDLPVLGHTVLKYDVKGIISTIEKLFANNNFVIAVIIGLFSIIFPIIKTIVMFISLKFNKTYKYIMKLGKWSMADVFVVSILIAILSIDSDEFTDANVEVGLYYFSVYVILSILSSYLIIHKNELIESVKSKKLQN